MEAITSIKDYIQFEGDSCRNSPYHTVSTQRVSLSLTAY